MVAKTKRLIVGNWKMYIENDDVARALVSVLKRKSKNFKKTEVWVAPPAPFISIIANTLKESSIQVGAQYVSQFNSGAKTGEVSATMLKDAGATFAIVGHSERRAGGESDEVVTMQLKGALGAGLYSILCVGESVRDEHGGHFEFIANQLRAALASVTAQSFSKIVVAYEPVWAIGKNAEEAAKPELVRETVIFIRKTLTEIIDRSAALKVPILYGGSVEGTNVKELIDHAGVNGFLVGRASTEAEKFWDIIKACDQESANSKIQKTRSGKDPKFKRTKSKAKRKHG